MKHLLFILLFFVLPHYCIKAQTKDTAQKNSIQQSGGIDSLWQVFNKMYDRGDSLIKIADSYFYGCNKDSAECYYVKAIEAFKEIGKEKVVYAERQRAELRNPEYCMNSRDKAYKTLIDKGDNCFNTKDYVQAKKYYEDASGIRPGEKYPKDRIAQCQIFIDQN
jgi:hypothetical protein